MAESTESTITINAAPGDVMDVIADFEAYPQWTGAVKKAEVVKAGTGGRAKEVFFDLDAGAIKDQYTLGYRWTGDEAVDWHIVQPGTMVAALTGSYRLVPAGDGTTVTYELSVDLKVPMIGMIKRKAEKVIIDRALKGLKERVEG